ncbi:MAG: hypothetical protein LBT40_14765 [Deltaproteobacteria bacterium]|nr:hypothetical protein [Deltaproteobacteria bacterium]
MDGRTGAVSCPLGTRGEDDALLPAVPAFRLRILIPAGRWSPRRAPPNGAGGPASGDLA